MKTYAYMRVSTNLQTTDNQRSKIAGKYVVDEWVVEHAVSGSIRALERPAFRKLIKDVQAGDCVISVSLDRLGRDTEDVLYTIRNFQEKGVSLVLMDLDNLDLTSDTGKIMVTLLSMVAEMERGKVIARTSAAVQRAREEGKVFGRYLKIPPKVFEELCEKREKGVTLDTLAKEYKLDRSTIAQTVAKWKDKLLEYVVTYNKQQAQKKAKLNKIAKAGK